MTTRTPAQYDWDKALFNDRRITKHFTSPRRSKITHVTLHHMDSVSSGTDAGNKAVLEGCYKTWMGSRPASANYGVAGDQVWQFVSDNDAPWADANSASNHSTLAIEHADATGDPTYKISDQTMQTGQRLVATLHRLYKLGRPSRKTVRVHRDYYATACPGPYMMAHLDDYIAAAARFYDGDKPVPPDAAKPVAPVWGEPETWKVGGVSADVKRLGERLIVHGFDALYSKYNGPDTTFTAGEDQASVKAFQLAQGWTGSDADGFPGPETFTRLAADPATRPEEPPVTSSEDDPAPTPPSAPGTPFYFRIMSMNQYADQYTGGVRSISAQQAVYDDAKPSVCLLTEVNDNTDHERWMKIMGGWPKVYAIADRVTANNHIYFLQDTWEIYSWVEHLLGSITSKAGTNQRRGATFAVLRHKATGQLQSFAVTHLSSATQGYTKAEALKTRAHEANNLVKLMRDPGIDGWDFDTAILGGDLNEPTNSPSTARGILSKMLPGLRDQGVAVVNGAYKTFQGINPKSFAKGAWLDDIFGRGLHSARVILRKGASDHLDLVATYKRVAK